MLGLLPICREIEPLSEIRIWPTFCWIHPGTSYSCRVGSHAAVHEFHWISRPRWRRVKNWNWHLVVPVLSNIDQWEDCLLQRDLEKIARTGYRPTHPLLPTSF